MKKMPRGSPPPPPFVSSSSIMANILVAFICLIILGPSSVIPVSAQSDSTAPAKSFPAFTPSDNYLINCGSSSPSTLPGNRAFQPDLNTAKYLAYSGRDIEISAPDNKNVPSPIYLSAKIFDSEATYTFHVTSPGLHWIRLHFFPLQNNEFNLHTAKFSVSADTLVLLHDCQMEKNEPILKEFLVNVTTERYAIKFAPSQGSVAFINAIEFVTAPGKLLDYSVPLLFP